MLYQVATGALSPANIAVRLRAPLSRQGNARVTLGEVRDLDAAARAVVLADGTMVPWNTLVVASGAQTSWFGQDRWADAACGLKTLEDATRLRGRILAAFEAAERCADAERRPSRTRRYLCHRRLRAQRPGWGCPAGNGAGRDPGRMRGRLAHPRSSGRSDATAVVFPRSREHGHDRAASRAVAQVFGRAFVGIPAWLLWLVVHLMQISRHENHLLVAIQWFWRWAWHQPIGPLILVTESDPD